MNGGTLAQCVAAITRSRDYPRSDQELAATATLATYTSGPGGAKTDTCQNQWLLALSENEGGGAADEWMNGWRGYCYYIAPADQAENNNKKRSEKEQLKTIIDSTKCCWDQSTGLHVSFPLTYTVALTLDWISV